MHTSKIVQPSGRPLRVLLADDNHDSTDTLAMLLLFAGCEIEVCYDGADVLPLAERFMPDVCILDLWMPNLDGWQIAKELRARAGERLLLLIALTGLGQQRDRNQSEDAGFDHHILKPGELQDLYNDIARFIQQMESRVLILA